MQLHLRKNSHERRRFESGPFLSRMHMVGGKRSSGLRVDDRGHWKSAGEKGAEAGRHIRTTSSKSQFVCP